MPSHAAAAIFRALESNTVLEEILIEGVPRRQRGIADGQLIESLPRMKGLKRLYVRAKTLKCYFQAASFLPSIQQNTSLEHINTEIDSYTRHRKAVILFYNALARNCSLRRAGELLALQPFSGMPIRSKSGLWCMAFEKFGANSDYRTDGNGSYTGASAIFKILQARPAILGKQLKRPVQTDLPQCHVPDNESAVC
jgi:hypothetical protein